MSAQGQVGGGSGVTSDVSEAMIIVMAVVLFIVIVLVFFFYLYAKRRVRRAASFVVASERVARDPPGRGLDAFVLRSLPVTVYRVADYKEGIECAVCLTELSEGDEARVLPKCSHGFHLACIDTWFRSDTTCPVCRAPVGSEESAAAPPSRENVPQSPAVPSGVLFWCPEEQINAGNSLQGPSSYAGSSVSEKPAGDGADRHTIEIPSMVTEGAPSSLSAIKSASMSPSPKFKSITRLLGLGKRAACPSQGPNVADIEQGHCASTPIPRAPTDPRVGHGEIYQQLADAS